MQVLPALQLHSGGLQPVERPRLKARHSSQIYFIQVKLEVMRAEGRQAFI